ncbi:MULTISPECIES: Uma2 family endonuclease [Streptomyces]|uniref:Endonuclease, Uma2 family (Restriction endonuclease fold) n=1 Tax=Streptomyces melanosporofaciens TaxID=67327 RepID=A0A1H4UA02_STRMJ|nr:Uma2 family endonuclease [Streptomyces melanosporofaciens]SEC65507.1 Endonuclease, Uma2 family (restriction endonuclease fold) [Streptomyces melanosporofaciens]
MTAEPLPAWAFPPPGGFTADDLDRMPELPPHTELIDGSLVFVSPQRSFHTLVMDLLVPALRALAPRSLRVRREMTIALDKRNRPEPDISILRAEAVSAEADETGYDAADAVLAVEVVSPESEDRDRKRKPQLYAEAGIRHFWLVEKGDGRRPVVHVFELDPVTRTYVPTSIHHDQLKVSVPFTIDIDLTEIDHL